MISLPVVMAIYFNEQFLIVLLIPDTSNSICNNQETHRIAEETARSQTIKFEIRALCVWLQIPQDIRTVKRSVSVVV